MGAYDPNAFCIYVDGSALKNPGGPGGFAGILEFPEANDRENKKIFQEGYRETTNNRMELRAVIRAFEYVRQNGKVLKATRFLIVTDSLYVSENYSRAPYWKRDGWRGESGRPMENPDLWNTFLSIQGKVGVRTTIVWHKGKKNEILKEIDRLAKEAARNPFLIDTGFRGGKIGKSQTEERGASDLFHARNQTAKIKIYKKKPAGKNEMMVFFTVFSEESRKYVEKSRAYTSAETAVQLHRFHAYEVAFNGNPKYPIIMKILAEMDADEKS